jgi:hypothetical protein
MAVDKRGGREPTSIQRPFSLSAGKEQFGQLDFIASSLKFAAVAVSAKGEGPLKIIFKFARCCHRPPKNRFTTTDLL